MRMSLSKSNTERLAQQRLEICGLILYILLVAWKRERLSLKVDKCSQCDGGIRCLGHCCCLVTKRRIAVLCEGPNAYAPGTGGLFGSLCII